MNNSISVVIPLFNKRDYIARAVKSVLAQSQLPDEIVVVDDGSSDDSVKIVKNINCSLVRIIETENCGVSATRNTGVYSAQCDLIAFLDADDIWLSDHLRYLRSAIIQFPTAVAAFANYSRSDDAKVVFESRSETPIFLPDYFEFCMMHRGLGAWTSAVLAKRKALVQCGGFPVGRRMGEDLDTWARLAQLGPFVFCPKPTATYMVGEGACSSNSVDCDVWESIMGEKKLNPPTTSAQRYAVLMRLITVESLLNRGAYAAAAALLRTIPMRSRLDPYGMASSLAVYFGTSWARMMTRAARRLGFGPCW